MMFIINRHMVVNTQATSHTCICELCKNQLTAIFCIPLHIPQFPVGMGISASTRVGNALGAGNVKQAITSYKVSIICTCKNECICLYFIREAQSHWLGPLTDFKY